MIPNRRTPTPSLSRLLALVMILALATETWGGLLEFEETDILPQVEDLVFSTSQVGLVSHDGRWFALDRQTHQVHQLDAVQFAQQFPKPWPPPPFENPRDRTEILRSSSGHEFQVNQAVCSEGDNIGHALRYHQRPFPDVLKPCTSVGALEVIRNQVWFGTVRYYEGGETDAEGVVVQALDKKQRLARILPQAGLTLGAVHVLREDPVTKTVWVATQRGLTQIDHAFRVRWAGNWYEDFDAASGRSQISLTATIKTSNVFAVLGRELGVQDWQAYRQMVQQIPARLETRGDTTILERLLYHMHMTGPVGEKGMFPKELNGLVPFLMQAAQSEDPMVRGFGLANLLKFIDPRIPPFLKELAATRDTTAPGYYWLREWVQRSETQKP